MDESAWRKERSDLYIECVYMPTDSTSVAVVDSNRVKEDVLCFRKAQLCC